MVMDDGAGQQVDVPLFTLLPEEEQEVWYSNRYNILCGSIWNIIAFIVKHNQYTLQLGH